MKKMAPDIVWITYLALSALIACIISYQKWCKAKGPLTKVVGVAVQINLILTMGHFLGDKLQNLVPMAVPEGKLWGHQEIVVEATYCMRAFFTFLFAPTLCRIRKHTIKVKKWENGENELIRS